MLLVLYKNGKLTRLAAVVASTIERSHFSLFTVELGIAIGGWGVSERGGMINGEY
jgi:hypothetical protein